MFSRDCAFVPDRKKRQTANFTRDVNFMPQGKVTYWRSNGGMGIAFTSIKPNSLPILDACLTNMRK
jgi:hypothetical protein